MRRTRLLLPVLAGTLAVAALTRLSPAGAGEATITIKGLSFIPEDLPVAVGDTVTWVNEDSDRHDLEGGPINSPPMAKGGTFTYTFGEAGEFEYRCKIHTYMQGRVVVGDGGAGSDGGHNEPPAAPPTTTTTAPVTTTTTGPRGPLGLPVPIGIG